MRIVCFSICDLNGGQTSLRSRCPVLRRPHLLPRPKRRGIRNGGAIAMRTAVWIVGGTFVG